ncbi:MAG: hypothetical protein ACRDSH_23835 [Pseudonocardiaceae bacterium]
MNRNSEEKTLQPLVEPMKDVFARSSLLYRLGVRRRAQRLERIRQARDRMLAKRTHDILAGCGLSQADYSIGGGRVVRVPEVVSVVAGSPMALNLRILPGQTPSDFAAHASAIAYGLGMEEVRVVPLAPSVIRLELMPATESRR